MIAVGGIEFSRHSKFRKYVLERLFGVTASAAGRVRPARGPGSRVRNLTRVYTEMGSMQSTSTRKGMTNGSFSVGKLIAIAFNAS